MGVEPNLSAQDMLGLPAGALSNRSVRSSMGLVPSSSVAVKLARIWEFHRTPQFLDYVADSFGVRPGDLAAFDKLYIYQLEEGDLERGNFMHETIFQWWEVDDAGIRECDVPQTKWSGWIDAPEKLRGSFYRWPHISFIHRGDRVGFGETFGPDLHNRKVGRIIDSGEIVEVKIVNIF